MADKATPLSAKDQRFITYYVICRDLQRAAKLAGYRDGKTGAKLYVRPDIRKEIDRRIGDIEGESDKLLATQVVEEKKAEILAEDFMDSALADVIRLDPKEHGRTKLSALQLAYVRKGVIQIGNQQAVVRPGDAPSAPAQTFYRAFEQTIHTRELVQPAEAPKLPAPPPAVEATQENNSVWKY